MFDLSHYQSLPTTTYSADQALFEKARAGGWIMMMHKLTQGAAFQDPVAVGRLKYASAAGLLVGAYHFMDPSHVGYQLANFMHMVGQVKQIIAPAKLMLCVDNEPDPASEASDVLAEEFAIGVFAATGTWPLVYGNRYNFWSAKTVGVMAGCPLWLAEYGTKPVCPPGWINWQFHQYSDGKAGDNPQEIPGIGFVDQSEFAGNSGELYTLFGGL